MENGLGMELLNLISFYNDNYAYDDYNKVKYSEVQRLAKTCSTGCEIADAIAVDSIPSFKGFTPLLTKHATKIR